MKWWIKRALFESGHYARRLRARAFPGVAVLTYHGVREDAPLARPSNWGELHVRASTLEGHCRVIRECCHPIGLAQWRAALAGGPPLPARPVLVTFDDGYRSVLTRALPILRSYDLPAVVFVTSGPVEQRCLFWFDALARGAGEADVEAAKGLPFDAWQDLVDRTPAALETDDPDAPLSIEELRVLAAAPGIEIGGHTQSHLILSRADRRTQAEDIVRGKQQLEEWIEKPVTAFAYPNGRPRVDYTAQSVEIVREAGYDIAFAARPRFALPDEAPLERSRFLMLDAVLAQEFAHRLSYSWLAQASASAS